MNETQYISDFLAPRDAWDKLSIEEQAAMMKTAISEGILDLNTIRQKYNEFAEGGNTDDDLVDWIIREEGFIANPRDIGDGKMTLGSGLTAQKWHDQYKRNGNKWTSSDNRRAVREEVANRRRWAERNIPNWDSLPSSSQKALLSYKYNYDFNQANSPKLFKALSDSNLQEAARQMDATSSNPIFKKGLQDRRQREQEWFLKDIVPQQVQSGNYLPAVSTQVYNPYMQQVEATRMLPIDEPDPNSYIRTREVSPQEQRRRKFQENVEAFQRFNALMNLIDLRNNPAPSYSPIYSLFGGDSDEYANGGKIHIKPSHRGRLTELKKRTGKTEAELYRTGGPSVRKMITFARNARKWKHGLGGSINLFGEDANLYGWGDWLNKTYNGIKSAVNKGREVVKILGLDKSPSQHLLEWIASDGEQPKPSNRTAKRPEENNDLGFWTKNAIATARAIGLNGRYKGEDTDTLYRRNIFNQVDPTTAVPRTIGEVYEFARTAEAAKSNKRLPYKRTFENPAADAAWSKRLGLPYDSTLLVSNPDGSVHLPQQLESEIPIDTTFLKNRIADNEKILNNIFGPKRQVVETALDFDRATLDSLRKTYKTGKPVTINEHSYVSRDWRGKEPKDIGPTPLSLLHRYTVQYDKDKNSMNYWDTYNFDEYEDFVPGNPFLIKGSINLDRRK